MSSSRNGRPERMYWRGRPIDRAFAPDERLYRRCTLDDLDGDHLSSASISFRGDSINRSKYSQPEDVLIPDRNAKIQDNTGCGIAYFEAQHVPAATLEAEAGGINRFTFGLEHKPMEENYSHSEITTFKNGKPERKPKLSQANRIKLKELREQFSRKTQILRRPTVHAPTKPVE